MERDHRLLGRGCGNGTGARQAFAQRFLREPPRRTRGNMPDLASHRGSRRCAGRAVGRHRACLDLRRHGRRERRHLRTRQFQPDRQRQWRGSATVSGGDTIGVSGAWTGAGGDPGYAHADRQHDHRVRAPNQLLSLGGKTHSVSTPDSITGTRTSVATYDSSAFAASTAGTTQVPVYHDVNGDQYVNTRIGTVAATGGAQRVDRQCGERARCSRQRDRDGREADRPDFRGRHGRRKHRHLELTQPDPVHHRRLPPTAAPSAAASSTCRPTRAPSPHSTAARGRSPTPHRSPRTTTFSCARCKAARSVRRPPTTARSYRHVLAAILPVSEQRVPGRQEHVADRFPVGDARHGRERDTADRQGRPDRLPRRQHDRLGRPSSRKTARTSSTTGACRATSRWCAC